MRRSPKRTSFVPRIVFATAVAGVVPAVGVACGGGGTSTNTVACSFMQCGVAAVAYMGFDASDAHDAPGDRTGDARDATDAPEEMMLGVADTGFGGDVASDAFGGG